MQALRDFKLQNPTMTTDVWMDGDRYRLTIPDDSMKGALEKLLKTNEKQEKIRRYIDFVEDMYANGDDDVQNIVGVTILECLGDDETVLRSAFSYFSEELMLASQSIEKGWGRRDIRIWHRGGRPQYDWKWPPEQIE